MRFVQIYAGHPHFYIKAVSLAEIHQLQVRLKRGSLLNSSAVLILMFRMKLIFVHFLKDSAAHWKMYLVHAFFSVGSGETFAKNNQLALRSRFKNCLVGN